MEGFSAPWLYDEIQYGGHFDKKNYILVKNLHNFSNKRRKVAIFVSISMFQEIPNFMEGFSES